jgi:hypothetical protein
MLGSGIRSGAKETYDRFAQILDERQRTGSKR